MNTSAPAVPGAATVLVLGARGRFGAAAGEAFAAAGWRVLAQARREGPSLPGVQALAIDLEDTPALARAAAGARVVVHAVNPPYTRWAADALRLARAGMDVAERLEARFVLPGNVYNFGAAMPPLLREDTPQRPTTRKGAIRVAMEQEMAARAAAGRLRATVVRAGDFFGGGAGSWLDLVILKSFAAGKLVYPGPTDVAHAWAYLPDLAHAVAALCAVEQPPFARWHFAGHTLTGAELLAAVERAAAALGTVPARGWRHGSVPWPLLRVAGLVVPMAREIAEMAYLWRRPHALDGSALAACIGAPRATPVDEAMRHALVTLGLGGEAGYRRASPAA